MMELATLAIKASLILMTAAAAAFLTRKRRAALRHWIWTAALVGLLVLPLGGALLPELPLLPHVGLLEGDGSSAGITGSGGPLQSARPDGQLSDQEATQNGGAGGAAEHARSGTLAQANSTQSQQPVQQVGASRWERGAWPAWLFPGPAVGDIRSSEAPPGAVSLLASWMLPAWLTGILFLLARLLREWIGVRRMAARARRWNPDSLEKALQRMGVGQKAQLLLSDTLEVPLTTGTRRPLILLPAEAREWPEERLTTVLLHEAAHIARRDHIWNLLGAAALALFWFHPVAWWAVHRMRLESDRACDDLVLESGVDALRYADELLLFARTLPSRRLTVPALADRSGLRTRLQSILDASRVRGRLRPASLAVLTTLSLLLLLPVAALSHREAGVSGGDPPAGVAGTDRATLPLTVEEALTQLRSDDPAQRRRAAWIMGEKEDRKAVAALIGALKDPISEVRAMAAWALGEIKDRSCLPALAVLAGDAESRVREMAALALGELETSRALPHLTRLAADHDPGVRSAAIWGLGETGGLQARQGILKALSDASPQVRVHAAQILGQKRMPEVSALLKALTDVSPRVRRESAKALGLLRASSAVADLAKALGDSHPEVRREAATALGRIGKSTALDALLAALNDTDLQVREQAVWALDEIRSE